MRGARENGYEYILELHSEGKKLVGGDGTAHVIVPEYWQILAKAFRCESDANKGGTTGIIPRPFDEGRGFFI